MLSRLFGGSPRAEREPDRVWLNDEARLRGVLASPGARIVAHFAQTRRSLLELARQQGQEVGVLLAGELPTPLQRSPALVVVVAERHPLREQDEAVARWADAAAGKVVFHVSLEDAPIAVFAGNGLRPLLERLGAPPGEPLCHPMISRAIESAQARIRKLARVPVPADSAAAWMAANGIGGPG